MTAATLAEWKDFFILASTAAATLLGLLFVAISVNSHSVLARKDNYLRHLAQQAYQSYMIVLIGGLVFLFPGFEPKMHVFNLGNVGAGGIVWSLYLAWNAARDSKDMADRRHIARRLIPAVIANLLLLYGGLQAYLGPSDFTLLACGCAMLLLLASATATAWDLLVRIGDLSQTGE